MRQKIDLCKGWQFTGFDGKTISVNVPHTWNNIDGQDGGNDYKRGTCTYVKQVKAPAFDPETQEVWLEFDGVNATADVSLNGEAVCHHDGGYSTFRIDVTEKLLPDNTLEVKADNSVNDKVYPQKADFTFYGGMYRAVRFVILNKAHFAMDHRGSTGIRVTPKVEGKDASVRVVSRAVGGEVKITLLNAAGEPVAEGSGADCTMKISNVHLWDGIEDPYLYICKAQVIAEDSVQDELEIPFGVRTFSVDARKGFFLNGRLYPLRGVSRHQDRKGYGNAITKEMHDEDMAMIREMGCNTVRLAHYQHDQYFYDLCDKYGMVVWAEIPYISEHMPNGRANTIAQMEELIEQNYNHASICVWGVSNEITISTKDNKDMLDNHRVLNDLCHKEDPTRLTTLACYAMCGPFNPVAFVTDLVSWNLYLGWYVPGLFLNDLWVDFFHLVHPQRPLGYSEYGAEGMPNLHSSHPKRNDHTEEYQAVYHEYLAKFIDKRPWMWATHVWNMYDFAADARDQGGEPGMNHKGLVTFDRKTKKDSFYLYKAWWSKEPFVHICSKRYVDRCENETTIKVYSNQPKITLFVDGKQVGESTGTDHVFTFKVPLKGKISVKAQAGKLYDVASFRHVDTPNKDYILVKKKNAQKSNWV